MDGLEYHHTCARPATYRAREASLSLGRREAVTTSGAGEGRPDETKCRVNNFLYNVFKMIPQRGITLKPM